ncbi:MAG TPA: TlpA disulfide reductase family protein [Kofleriaceae bacterium]
MANGASRATNPPGAVVIDPRVLICGGLVALVGLAVLGAFLWMVPHAAAREVRSACEAMRPIQPNAAAHCVQGDEACERSITLAQALCKPGEACKFPMPAPDFSAVDYRGKQVHLSDFRGKVVLLNFWASWCGVCESEKPHLNAMAGDLGGDDFAVIALASDHNWTAVLLAIVKALAGEDALPKGDHIAMPQALASYQQALPDGVPFHVFLDPPADDGNIGAIAASWGIHAVPDSVVIDRQGNIRAYFVNKRDWQSPVAETCLRSLIDGN